MTLTATDYEQIKQLHARYGHTIDFEDVEGLVSCFAPDGAFDGPEHEHRGHDQIREFGAAVAKNQLGHVRHSMISSLIDGDGDTARSLTYALITRDYGPPEGKGQTTHSAVLTTGLYSDDMVKIDGRWVYAKRSFRHDGWSDVLGRLHQPLEIQSFTRPDNGQVPEGALTALDREEIRQLLARYCYTLDFGDYDGFLTCFSQDGTFGSLDGDNPIRGHERLREFAVYCDEKVRGHAKHSCINLIIEGDARQASVASYGFIPMDYGSSRQWNQRDNATVGTTGIYRDQVKKIDGRWLFTRRTFSYDGYDEVKNRVGRPLNFEPLA